MTPILFPANTQAGGFTSHGLGNISDAASFLVTEQLNGAYTAAMTVPVDSIRYGDLRLDCLVLAKPNPDDDPQPFRVRRFSRPIRGLVTVYLEHWSYDLSGYPAGPFTAEATTAAEAVDQINDTQLVSCPFTLSTDIEMTRPMNVKAPTSTRQLMGDQTGQLLSVYGGEWRYVDTTAQLLQRRGADRGFSIRYGKNLVDLKQEELNAEVYSAVVPYWLGNDGQLVQGTQVDNPNGLDVVRVLSLDLSASFRGSAPTVSSLDTACQEWIEKNKPWVPRVSLDIKFAQIAEGSEYGRPAGLDDLRLGDTVEVVYERLGVSVRSRVIETVYDTLRDRWQSVKIGDPKITISDTVVETKQAAGAAGGAARRAQDTADQAAFDLAEFLDNLANGTTAANTLVCQYLNIIPSGHTGFITIGGGGSPLGSNYGPSVKTVKDSEGNNITIHYLGLD